MLDDSTPVKFRYPIGQVIQYADVRIRSYWHLGRIVEYSPDFVNRPYCIIRPLGYHSYLGTVTRFLSEIKYPDVNQITPDEMAELTTQDLLDLIATERKRNEIPDR